VRMETGEGRARRTASKGGVHRMSEPLRTVAAGRRAWRELRRLAAAARTRVTKPLKYHNRVAAVDGHRFASQREARRYAELRVLERAGVIRDLELQPEFLLYVAVLDSTPVLPATKIADALRSFNTTKGAGLGLVAGLQPVGSYFADFCYRDAAGAIVVEDAKGFQTPLYRFKRRMVEAQYGIVIQEV
jgi:hypothetical protein